MLLLSVLVFFSFLVMFSCEASERSRIDARMLLSHNHTNVNLPLSSFRLRKKLWAGLVLT
jgi:hypothetical protein